MRGLLSGSAMDRPHRRFIRSKRALLAGLGILGGCTAPIVTTQPPARSYYLTAPGYDVSPELEELFRSVHQIEYTAEYTTYTFDEAAGVTEDDIYAGGFEARADTSYSETLAKAGTATVIRRSVNRLTLLTVAHVVRYPEFRFQFYEDAPGRRSRASDVRRRVASASVLIAERGHLLPRSGPLRFEVQAMDERLDLAMLRIDLSGRVEADRFPAVALDAGNARSLAWGSFLYVLGYPRGYPLVTRMIVSNPDRDGQGGFITDGIWNEGMSGGLIVAIRGNTGALELVGLARASAAEREFRLVPDTAGIVPGAPTFRYDGPLWLETGLRPTYGIGLPIPMTSIEGFLRAHRVVLRGSR
jgi:S1-C subfamily serine protease